ncbi:MarR family transcriptional regulator [Hoyosella sp. YIM 151337]|uniref:MarR family winged helix-turn-helix transcriptional regulator n=1 Tax=Hoyosella sp. YIM 151337 TaxID=2992742 RepID=UPI0022358101|nr:MarR family transcriptional regulator [Hoyosella sp. YIM 151337]MCW4354294.1 MarR family transcriptional regulator [Hoyosella sp. YIM 151337]
MQAHHDDDAIAELGQEFVRFWRQGRAEMRRSAREVHPRLEPPGYQLMNLLHAADAVPTSELLCEMGAEKSTLSRQLAALERLGLAERTPDPNDSRARLVALTAQGRTLIDRQRERNAERWRAKFATWDESDIRTLTALLRRSLGD